MTSENGTSNKEISKFQNTLITIIGVIILIPLLYWLLVIKPVNDVKKFSLEYLESKSYTNLNITVKSHDSVMAKATFKAEIEYSGVKNGKNVNGKAKVYKDGFFLSEKKLEIIEEKED